MLIKYISINIIINVLDVILSHYTQALYCIAHIVRFLCTLLTWLSQSLTDAFTYWAFQYKVGMEGRRVWEDIQNKKSVLSSLWILWTIYTEDFDNLNNLAVQN